MSKSITLSVPGVWGRATGGSGGPVSGRAPKSRSRSGPSSAAVMSPTTATRSRLRTSVASRAALSAGTSSAARLSGVPSAGRA